MIVSRHRIAVFASGRGTNAERLFAYFEIHPHTRIALLVSSSASAPVLETANRFAIPTYVMTASELDHADTILHQLTRHDITHLVLAGFLWLLPAPIVAAYRDCIVNIHPALLPRYGGKGMYGMHVHRAVKRAGESESGITIHGVNERYDEGEILFQARCRVDPTDTPDRIADKVQQLEHEHYARVVDRWIEESNT